MNKFSLLAVLSTSLLIGNAYAADLYIPDDEVLVINSSATDWSGFYAGLSIGKGAGNTKLPPAPVGVIGIDNFDQSGGIAGVQVGGNAQYGNLVVGVEADAAITNVFGRGDLDILGILTVGTDTNINALGTVRGRIGVAADNLLFYATAGLAAASVSANGFEEAGGVRTVLGSPTVAHIGFVVGAGLEAMIAENISIKGEYLYHQFGASSYDYGAGGVDQSFNLHTVKVGANFHF